MQWVHTLCLRTLMNILTQQDFPEGEDIRCMERPACSPDMNAFAHAWDALGRRITARQPPPRIIPDFHVVLNEE